MFRRRKSLLISFLSIALISTLLSANFTLANGASSEFSNCLLAASKNQGVSLGSPLASERLAHKTNIRIGVLPVYFKDGQVKQLSEIEKTDYLDAATYLRKISNNLITVQIVFLDGFKLDKNQDVLKQAYTDRNLAWSNQSTTQGTWGFVRDVISLADSTRDFSNLDSLIIEANNVDRSFSIAEAMDFFRGTTGNVYRFANSEFFKTIKTQDGFIDNAVLLDNHKGLITIVHELLHNFGLTDLYGSRTGPGFLSIMASGAKDILNYEKAVLGWFPKEKFQCKNLNEVLKMNSVDNLIEIPDAITDSILLLKKSEDTAYLFEVINYEGKSLLVVYLLEQELRPPITAYPDPKAIFLDFFDLSDPKSIGSKYSASDFEVLITNLKNDSVSLNLIPNSMANSEAANSLATKSLLNRDLAIADIKAKADAKADAEAKAKADAEAKAKADAEAKAKVEVKKSTITCTKGKITKKITGVNPKCPLGFKKK